MGTTDVRAELAPVLDAERAKLEAMLAEQERLAAAQARIVEQLVTQRARVTILEELLGSRSPSERATSAKRAGSLKIGSRVGRAYAYLCEIGESQHVRDILIGIGDTDSPNKRNALSSQINRYIEQGRFFSRDDAKGSRYFGAISDGDEDESDGE